MLIKRLLLVLFVVTLSPLTYSQSASLFELGLRGSVDADISNNNNIETSLLGGYNAGVMACLNFPVGIGVQSEILLHLKNIKPSDEAYTELSLAALADNEKLNFDKGEEIKQLTVSLPLLFNYNFLKFFSLQVGPQFNFLINPDSYKIGDESFSESFQTQGVAGLKVSISSFSFYLRYIQDITSLGSSKVNDILQDVTYSKVQLGVGYSFLKF